MIDWTEESLGNILKFYNGKAIKVLSCGKYPVYGSNGKIGFSNESRFCKSIIIGRVGAYCGSVYLELDEYWASDNTIVATVKNKNNLNFVYFLLRSFPLNDLAGGSAQPLLNQSILSRIKVKIPPLKTQQKIAAILSTYDDLIENNKRRINLLEKMSEDIYREWFVRFRFPGWQNTDFDKGIPQGWEVKPFSELVYINPTEKLDQNDEKYYVGMEALSTDSMYFESSEKRRGNSGSKFRNGDTLFPRITPSLENGKRGFVCCLEDNQVGMGSTEFLVFREKILSKEYIYLLSCFEPFRVHAQLSMVGSSGRQRVANSCFSFFVLPVPPKKINLKFSEIVKPLFEKIKLLSTQNKLLNETKNQLLPRLISGKLSVDNLNIKFPPSME